MPRKRQTLDQLKSLPRCEGPKLAPFADRQSSIDFIRLLECSNSSDSESSEESSYGGAHGYVFEVLIGSKRYALKIVSLSLPRNETARGSILTMLMFLVQVLQ